MLTSPQNIQPLCETMSSDLGPTVNQNHLQSTCSFYWLLLLLLFSSDQYFSSPGTKMCVQLCEHRSQGVGRDGSAAVWGQETVRHTEKERKKGGPHTKKTSHRGDKQSRTIRIGVQGLDLSQRLMAVCCVPTIHQHTHTVYKYISF